MGERFVADQIDTRVPPRSRPLRRAGQGEHVAEERQDYMVPFFDRVQKELDGDL
jgi:hypothetical protein